MSATSPAEPPAVRADLVAEAERAHRGAVVDPARFRGVAADLVQRAARARDAEALVVALRAEAWAEHELLDNERARALLDRAVRLARRHGLDARHAELLLSRAAVASVLGRFDAAERDLAQAAVLAGTASPDLLLQQATLLANRGRLADAAPLYRRVLEDRSCPPEVTWKVANNLAMIEALSGRAPAAVRCAERAVSLASGLGPVPVAIASQTEAWVTVQAGRLQEGLRRFERAGELYARAGLPLAEHYLEYADALLDLRLLPEALVVAQQAVEQLRGQRAPLMAAEAELRLARLRLLTGDHGVALEAAQLAAGLLRRQRRTTWLALADVLAHDARERARPLTGREVAGLARSADALEQHGLVSAALHANRLLARAALRRGDRRTALVRLERAGRPTGRPPLLVRVQQRLAAAEHAEVRGDAAAVLDHARRGLRDLDRHRSALPTMELRALASGHGAELGTLGLRALSPGSSAGRLFAWMERTRAAALLPVSVPEAGAPPAELAALRSLHAELEQARRATGAEPPDLVREIAAAELAVRRASWSADGPRATERRPAPTVARVRALLRDETLVEHGRLDGRLLAVVLQARRARVVDLGPEEGLREDVDALLFSLRRLARPGTSARSSTAAAESARALLARLRARLVAPLEVDPRGGLVVVPVGDLQRLPWTALHDGPVAVVPSAASWVRAREAPPDRRERVALVAGPDLPGAVEEVQALAAQHRRATVLLPPTSTVPAVLAALRDSGVAHLACHGRIRLDNPMFSSLLLSDGPLTVHELALGGAAPHRVVLAACDSGVQVGAPGDEALGFVSALLAAGSGAVLASSVLLPDVGALPLLERLHQHLREGAPLSDALHRARSEVDQHDPRALASACSLVAYGAA